MNACPQPDTTSRNAVTLPEHRDAYYGGAWHKPQSGRYVDTINPGTGELLGEVADCRADGYRRGGRGGEGGLQGMAPRAAARSAPACCGASPQILRENARGAGDDRRRRLRQPGSRDGRATPTIAAAQIEFFAGLVTEMKGASIPMGPDAVNFSVREPRGVVGRIIPFNHPFMFCAGKAAAPLAAGNTVVMKPPEQAPLSSLRLAELRRRRAAARRVQRRAGRARGGRRARRRIPDVAMVALIGSVPTGRAVMKAASDTLKPVMLELGGKNALIAYPDADPDEVAGAVIGGMNFTWCGQSCGSTSRAFIHEKIYDAVIDRVKAEDRALQAGHPDRSGHHDGRDHLADPVRPRA